MFRMTYLIATIMLMTPPIWVNAGGVNNAKVVYAGIYGNGRLFVQLDKEIVEPGCNRNRFDVDAGNPSIQSWLSIAMASAVSGKTVNVGTNGCFTVYPTLTQDANSFFFLNNN